MLYVSFSSVNWCSNSNIFCATLVSISVYYLSFIFRIFLFFFFCFILFVLFSSYFFFFRNVSDYVESIIQISISVTVLRNGKILYCSYTDRTVPKKNSYKSHRITCLSGIGTISVLQKVYTAIKPSSFSPLLSPIFQHSCCSCHNK